MPGAPDLDGAAVIVTRPRQQAGALCRAIKRRGGEPVVFPCVTIEPLRPVAPARRALARLGAGDWAVFTSANAVLHGLEWFPRGRLPGGVRAAAVGQATARSLRARGVKRVLVPDGGSDSEALLEALGPKRVSGHRFALVKGTGGRRLLARELRRGGAEVISLAVYRRGRPAVELDELGARLPARAPVVTTATSGEILNNLLHMVDADTLERLRRAPLVVISERIAGLARWSGFGRVTVSNGPGAGAVADAVARSLRNR